MSGLGLVEGPREGSNSTAMACSLAVDVQALYMLPRGLQQCFEGGGMTLPVFFRRGNQDSEVK